MNVKVEGWFRVTDRVGVKLWFQLGLGGSIKVSIRFCFVLTVRCG